MRTGIKAVFLTLALAGGSLMAAQPAHADRVVVAVGPAGGVAFGYRDGYWDRAHAWHRWENQREAAAWRRANRAHYYNYAHTHRGDGWRAERWW
ncbi:MAG TPA: hypothetical protein VL899_13740 [Alphaproteobacteria bacterium]|jgi:hypothetical protein|nr:hypothetical protein [Alphaproteobacteria bacterium]